MSQPKSARNRPQQDNPLLPGYPFNLHLVAGTTPIERGGEFDFVIDRPAGLMKGYSLVLTLDGGGTIHDGDEVFDCGPGDLLLWPPGVRYLYGLAESQQRWHPRWVYFRPRGFWAAWLNWPGRPGGIGRIHLPSEALRQEFDQLFQQIDTTHRLGRSTSEELAMNLLERLLIRCHEERPDVQAKPMDPRVLAACQVIANHLTQDLSLEEIAQRVHLSPSRLAHVFRSHTGVSIMRWREDHRITLAKQMLQSPGVPISLIAARVGYEDHLYFSRVFRKRVGVSPSEYRQSCLESPAPWG